MCSISCAINELATINSTMASLSNRLIGINAYLFVMKKTMLTLISSLLFCTLLFSQDYEGIWLGKLPVEANYLALGVTISKTTDGKFKAIFASPDQAILEIPTGNIVVTDSILIPIPIIGAKFIGAITNNNLGGYFHQGGNILPITFYRQKKPINLNKPQTPKPTTDYKTDSVVYKNEVSRNMLGATFSYSTSNKLLPAIILITGSGQQDRDERIGNHKPFAVLADMLTRQGFAVLRVDDRGIGKSTGNFSKATTEDFVTDVNAGINWLKNQPQVDTNKIGLIGHSEGGLIAPMVACTNKRINFIVMLAGPGTNGKQVLVDQVLTLVTSTGVSTKAGKKYQKFYSKLIDIALEDSTSLTAKQKVKRNYEVLVKSINAAQLKKIGYAGDSTDIMITTSLLKTFSTPWMRYFVTINPADYLSKLNCKVLAINGEKDIQVIANKNIPLIKKALRKSNADYTTEVLPGLNHLFQKCNICTGAEYFSLEETINDAALAKISTWLQQNILSK